MRDILIFFSYKYSGDWNKIYRALENREPVDKNKLKNVLSKIKEDTITIIDEEYPDNLKHVIKPPFVLYLKGNKRLLQKEQIIWPFASYLNSAYKKETSKIINSLYKNKITLLTGFTDTFENYLINNVILLNIVLVKDSGINSRLILTKKVEDSIIKNQGLIISEYPGYVIPSLKTWEESNRIKISLSKGLFLINSLKEKKTFKLIREMLEEGKEVYAWNIFLDNKNHNNMLISNGAYSIGNTKEILK